MINASQLLEDLATNEDLRKQFHDNRASLLEQCELSPSELEAFQRIDFDELERLVPSGVKPVECRILRITW